MNLSKDLSVDKELFSGTLVKENTMNLSKDLSVDKELFSGTLVKENTCHVVGYYIECVIDNDIYEEDKIKENIEVIIVKSTNNLYYSIRLTTVKKLSWTSWIDSFGYLEVKFESHKIINKITHFPIHYYEIDINDLDNVYEYTCDFFTYSYVGDDVEEISFGYSYIYYHLFTKIKPIHTVLHQLKMKFVMDELINNIMHPDNISYISGLDLCIDY